MNHVTIFSNGIGDFRRIFQVKEGQTQKVSIPVNRGHIGDILASLDIYGPVTLTVPPSFIPENQIEGKLTLDTDDVFCSLATKLAGAEVNVSRGLGSDPIVGTLMGLHTQQRATNGEAVKEYYVAVLAGGKLQNVAVASILNMEFTDPAVQAEITKALRRQFESLRPQMTTVNFEAKPTKDGDMTVHYTVPTAAWKMSYRLRDSGAGVLLEGFAIVDNNTEEDWNDVLVSVVAGEPVTFKTDLAQSKIPHRSSINVVADRVAAAFEVERGMTRGRSLRKAGAAMMMAPPSNSISPSVRMGGGYPDDANSLQQLASGDAAMDAFYTESVPSSSSSSSGTSTCDYSDESAFEATAEAREVGDFSVFESTTPISIGAGQSATLPVFSTALDSAKSVLYYRDRLPIGESEHPYRSLQFKNESGHSLGRGVCTIYEKGTYGGSCILPSCRPNEERMLPHAIETGVRVRRETKNEDSKYCLLRIGKGIAHAQTVRSIDTVYRIENTKDEQFQLVLDHTNWFNGGDSCKLRAVAGDNETWSLDVEPTEGVKNGSRFSIVVAANSNFELVVSEEQIFTGETHLQGDYGFRWIDDTIISQKLPLSDGIKKCIAAKRKWNDKQQERVAAANQLQTVKTEQTRVIELLKSSPNNTAWQNDLQTTETEIRKLSRTEIPNLDKEIEKLRGDFEVTLESMTFEWKG